MVLVSHKTKTPYKGPQYDLHKGALAWLERYGFFSTEGLNWGRNQIFFEKTKNAKVARIESLECTHYIDDLPEILELIPKHIKGILYDPKQVHEANQEETISHWNQLIENKKTLIKTD